MYMRVFYFTNVCVCVCVYVCVCVCVFAFWDIGLLESKWNVHFEMLAGTKQVNHLTVTCVMVDHFQSVGLNYYTQLSNYLL